MVNSSILNETDLTSKLKYLTITFYTTWFLTFAESVLGWDNSLPTILKMQLMCQDHSCWQHGSNQRYLKYGLVIGRPGRWLILRVLSNLNDSMIFTTEHSKSQALSQQTLNRQATLHNRLAEYHQPQDATHLLNICNIHHNYFILGVYG